MRREVPVTRGMTYEDLCFETLVLAGVLMKEALIAYDENRWRELKRPQGDSKYPTFRNASEDILKSVREKLTKETYAHYID